MNFLADGGALAASLQASQMTLGEIG